jgi:predicted ABC-type transport system involved in lysophospholipase L1 biosynthesis ATPase subunit
MGAGAVIKIGSGIQKLIGGIHRQQGDLISLLLFFQNKESGLKMMLISHRTDITSPSQRPNGQCCLFCGSCEKCEYDA